MWRSFFQSLACVLFGLTYRAYSLTWRITHVNYPVLPAGTSLLYAHWHGDELVLISAYRHSRMAVMASRSRDGELQSRFLSGLGYHVVRGSSSRGGVGGLKGLLDAVMKRGFNASLAVDGPRGPAYRVKPGIIKLAQITGRPLIPGAAVSSRSVHFRKSWNHAFLPAPFSRTFIAYGEPLYVPREADGEQLEVVRLELERRLISLKVEGEKKFNRQFDWTFRPAFT